MIKLVSPSETPVHHRYQHASPLEARTSLSSRCQSSTMHSFQSEDDYHVPHSMTGHSQSLGQVARKFPYHYSYDTHVLGKDKPVPHPPSKEKKKSLRRTQSNPEGVSSAEHGEGLQMNHLPALKDTKTALRMGKTTDQTTLGMTNELSVLTAKMHIIPETPFVETTQNTCRMSPVDMRNTHKKLERSKTTPVTFLKPLLKTSPVVPRRRVHLAAMYLDDQHGLPSRTQNTTTNSCRVPFECEGRIYGTMDTESQGIFKELEKTYDSPAMTRALPNGRRFDGGRMEVRNREEQLTNRVVNVPPSPKIRANNGGKEKRVQPQGKFTRTGQLIAGLQFIDGNDEDTTHETQEKNTEDSLELTYLRFTKERQEDNRI